MDKINRNYMEDGTIRKINQAFYQSQGFPSIQLHDFFSIHFYNEIKKKINESKFVKDISLMNHSYSKSKIPNELNELFNSDEFRMFVSRAINKKVKKINAEIRIFSRKDYTILHDAEKEKPGYELILDFTDDWDDQYGGSVVYVDGSGEYFNIPVKGNTLLVVERKKGIHRFIQYLNHLSKGKRRVLAVAKLN